MLYSKEGFPEEDDIVLCTVTAVHGHSVFVKLDEYSRSGMIHISEVSPGRIRNIRDYVVEGKKIVCKVLRIDKKKGHIDLSLRRVNAGQKKNKISEIKQEQKAEKIIEGISKKLDKELRGIYNEVSKKIFEKYEYVHECFNDIVIGKGNLEKLGVDKEIADELTAAVKEKIKPPEVEIKGILKLKSYDPEGIEIIKSALKKVSSLNISVKYDGGGDYGIIINAPDYKEAERLLKNSMDKVERYMEKKKGIFSFVKKEK